MYFPLYCCDSYGKIYCEYIEIADEYTALLDTTCCVGGAPTDWSSAYGRPDRIKLDEDSCKEDCNCTKKCEPKNNDGRDTCYWCGKKTKLIDTGMTGFNYCESCKK